MSENKTSIIRKAIVRSSLAMVVIILVATITVFYVVRDLAHTKALRQHEVYIKERVARESAAFDRIRDIHAAAKTALLNNLSHLSDDVVKKEYPALFPLQPDGTRRSVDGLFDGMALSGGRYAQGIGAFFGDGDKIPPFEQKLLLSSFEVVRAFGEASAHDLDSLYFFTPDNELVIYAPKREDKLMFYRHYAPAGFNYTNEDLSTITLPENNPNRVTRCTGLFAILYDQTRNVWTTGCQTPVDINGVHVGNFGTSLLLNDYLKKAVQDHLDGAYNMIWSSKGELIAHPEFVERDKITPMTMNIMQTEREDFKKLWLAIEGSPDKGNEFFQIETDDKILSVGHINVPDWYFVSVYPHAKIQTEAMSVAFYVLIVGLLVLVATPLVVGLVLRKDVSNPLRHLVKVSDNLTEGQFGKADDALWQGLIDRSDEIGGLSRSMKHMSDVVSNTFEGLEKTVGERTAALTESKEKAERVVDENRYYLAMISHDIRSPLGAIMAISEELADTDLNEEQQHYLKIIMNSADSVLELANGVLELSRIESEGITLDNEGFSFIKLHEEVCGLARFMCDAKNIGFKASSLPVELRFVGGDTKRVRQVMMNLLTNAIKFTSTGEVSLAISYEKATGPYHWVDIKVSDTGIGIAPEKLDVIFQPYRQAENDTASLYGGSGLGLSIVKKLVEAMSGEIRVESTLGQGSVFHARVKLGAVRMV